MHRLRKLPTARTTMQGGGAAAAARSSGNGAAAATAPSASLLETLDALGAGVTARVTRSWEAPDAWVEVEGAWPAGEQSRRTAMLCVYHVSSRGRAARLSLGGASATAACVAVRARGGAGSQRCGVNGRGTGCRGHVGGASRGWWAREGEPTGCEGGPDSIIAAAGRAVEEVA